LLEVIARDLASCVSSAAGLCVASTIRMEMRPTADRAA
jgi:hypothetical protein